VKDALVKPCGTATPEGAMRAGLLLATVMNTPEVGFDRLTVQEALAPTVRFLGVQVRDESVGTDDKERLADWEDPPRAAVMTPVVFAAMAPAVTLKVCVLLPAGIIMLAGAVSRVELELIATVAFACAAADKTTVHRLVLPDVSVAGEQLTDVTNVPASSWIAADAADPL
jgi:hypothetical protein